MEQRLTGGPPEAAPDQQDFFGTGMFEQGVMDGFFGRQQVRHGRDQLAVLEYADLAVHLREGDLAVSRISGNDEPAGFPEKPVHARLDSGCGNHDKIDGQKQNEKDGI